MYSFMQHNGAVDSIYIGHFAVLGQGGINIEIRNILHDQKFVNVNLSNVKFALKESVRNFAISMLFRRIFGAAVDCGAVFRYNMR